MPESRLPRRQSTDRRNQFICINPPAQRLTAHRHLSSKSCIAPSTLLGLVVIGVVVVIGCGPSLEQTNQAESWPLAPLPAAPPPGTDANSWPQFRGFDAAGVGYGHPPVRFGPNENLRWRAPLLGLGHSSPVVIGDLVLLTTAVEENNTVELYVLGISRHDGAIRFQSPVGRARGRTHAKNGYASPTVVADQHRVFAFFGAAGLFCCNLEGKPLWHVEFPNIDHQWGFGSSPILYGDSVIVVADGESEAFIAAFDRETGARRWRTERPSRGCWSTPIIVRGVRGTDELIVNGTTHDPSGTGWVIAYDANDGRELWRIGGTETFVTPTMLQCGPWVYSLSGRNGPIMALRPGGRGDVSHTHVVWKTRNGGPYIPSALAYRNRLFVVDDGGRTACYDAGDGRCLWRTRLSGAFTASVVAAGGNVYAVNESGTVYVFAADDQFQLLAENRLNERCYATPAPVGDELFVRTHQALWCFVSNAAAHASANAAPEKNPPAASSRGSPTNDDRSDSPQNIAQPTPAALEKTTLLGPDCWPVARGDARSTGYCPGGSPKAFELIWTFRGQGGFEGAAAVVEGNVYVGDNDGKFYALRLSDGAKQWEFDARAPITASAAVADGKAFFGDTDGVFHCLDTRSGEELWRFSTEGPIDNGANLHGENVLFGSQDGFLYCLRLSDGQMVWKYDAGDQLRSVPTIAEPWALVAGCDGRLHIVRLSDGQLDGQAELGSPTGSTPSVAGDRALVGTEGNEFLAIDFRRRETPWRYQPHPHPAAFRSSAACDTRLAVVGGRDKHLHALDVATGELRWKFPTKARADGPVVIVGRCAIAGAADGRLYMIDIDHGHQVDVFEAGGDITASPAVARGRLVVGNSRGQLYCLGLIPADP